MCFRTHSYQITLCILASNSNLFLITLASASLFTGWSWKPRKRRLKFFTLPEGNNREMLLDSQPRPRVESSIILPWKNFLCLHEEFILPVVNKDKYCMLITRPHASIYEYCYSTVFEKLNWMVKASGLWIDDYYWLRFPGCLSRNSSSAPCKTTQLRCLHSYMIMYTWTKRTN